MKLDKITEKSMAIYNGVYSWDGTKVDGQEPIAWSGGSYNVTIYKRHSKGNIELLKPYVCVYSMTGEGQSISANPEKFAKQLCHEFSLDIERVLWVEHLLVGDVGYEVVMFTRSVKLGKIRFYKTEKRRARKREIDQLKQELEVIDFS